jgi:hypothetical protein
MNAPRRKVVESYRSLVAGCTEYYECKLTCGHTVTAYGMSKTGPFGQKHAPKTCSCFKCKNEAEGKP